jgi:predicted RNA binding protein YcfA (HicA-like mRNA interferase family)
LLHVSPSSPFSPLRQPRITAAQLLRALHRAGFNEIRRSGSHIRLRSPGGHAVTVPFHAGEILKPKTLRTILLESGLTTDELRELL